MTAEAESPPRPRRSRAWRVLVFLLLIGSLYAAAKSSGHLDNIDLLSVQRAVERAGAWGVGAFVLLFVVGILLNVPGILFVGTAIALYGRMGGYVLSWASATLAVTVSFALARTVTGQALTEVRWKWMRRLLARIDERPIVVMIVFRFIFFLSPPLNYLIAMTRIRMRDFVVGSAIGLVIPMLTITLLFDWLLATDWARNLLMG